MKIFESKPNYEEWCKENDLNPDNDDNHDTYCEWKANG